MSIETFLKKIPINTIVLVTLVVLLVIIVLINSVFTIPDMKKELKVKKERFYNSAISTTSSTSTSTSTSTTEANINEVEPCSERRSEDECYENDNKCTFDWNKCVDKRCNEFSDNDCPEETCQISEVDKVCENKPCHQITATKCPVDGDCKISEDKCIQKNCGDYNETQCNNKYDYCLYEYKYDYNYNPLKDINGNALGVCKTRPCEDRSNNKNCEKDGYCKLENIPDYTKAYRCKSKDCSEFFSRDICNNSANCKYNDDDKTCKKKECSDYKGNNVYTCPTSYDSNCELQYDSNCENGVCKDKCVTKIECSKFDSDDLGCNDSGVCEYDSNTNSCKDKICANYTVENCPTYNGKCFINYIGDGEICADPPPPTTVYDSPPYNLYLSQNDGPGGPGGPFGVETGGPGGPGELGGPFGPFGVETGGPGGPGELGRPIGSGTNILDTSGQGDGSGNSSGKYSENKLVITTTTTQPTTTTEPAPTEPEPTAAPISTITTTQPTTTKPVATKYISTMPSPKNTSAPLYGIKTGNYKGLGNIFLPMMKINEGNRKDTITKIKINNNPVFTEEKEKD